MNQKNEFYRTPLHVRFCHIILVICFFIAAFSGLSLFFPSLVMFSYVLGTPQLVRLLHPFMGIAVFTLLMFMLFNLAKDNIPNRNDIRWLKNINQVIVAKEPADFPIGKYNAGQKLLFWCIMVFITVLLLTGLVIWRRYFAAYFPIGVLRFAALFHAMAGVGLMLLIIGHAYMAIWVKGSIRGMILGYVPRAWARKNHSIWYKQEMKQVFAATKLKKQQRKT